MVGWQLAVLLEMPRVSLLFVLEMRNFGQLGAYGLSTSLFACFCIAGVSVCAYFN